MTLPIKNQGDIAGFGIPESDTQDQIDDLTSRIQSLENLYALHFHSGIDTNRINLFDLFGLFETTSDISKITNLNPTSVFDQIKIYVNGGTKQLYIYDATNKVWRVAGLS